MSSTYKPRQDDPPTESTTPDTLVNKHKRKASSKKDSDKEVGEFSGNNGNGSADPGHKSTTDETRPSYYYSSSSNSLTAQLQQWYFQQLKTTATVSPTAPGSPLPRDESLSCLAFNNDGDMLATGNRAGQISVYQKNPRWKDNNEDHYIPGVRFQSHSSEFDSAQDGSIRERINKMTWLRRPNPAHFLLATNDRTIKLWKLAEKTIPYSVDDDDWNFKKGENHEKSITRLRIPKVIRKPPPTEAVQLEPTLRRDYRRGHTYKINSISLSSDQETYLSADDLKVNLWNLDITSSKCFNIVDMKPKNMEPVNEVITTAEFHPISSHLFAFGSNEGLIRLCDLRSNSTCDNHSKLFGGEDSIADPLLEFQRASGYSEIICGLTSVSFSHCGTYVGARDYLSVRIWDTRMESTGRGPVECYPCYGFPLHRLKKLDKDGVIFDEFGFSWAPDDKGFCTGSYGNNLYFADCKETISEIAGLMPSRVHYGSNVVKLRKVINMKDEADNGRPTVASAAGASCQKKKKLEGALGEEDLHMVNLDPNKIDYSKKLQHLAWHPCENLIAGADGKDLVLFYEKKKK